MIWFFVFYFLLHCGLAAYNHLMQCQKEGLIKVYEKRSVKGERRLSNFYLIKAANMIEKKKLPQNKVKVTNKRKQKVQKG